MFRPNLYSKLTERSTNLSSKHSKPTDKTVKFAYFVPAVNTMKHCMYSPPFPSCQHRISYMNTNSPISRRLPLSQNIPNKTYTLLLITESNTLILCIESHGFSICSQRFTSHTLYRCHLCTDDLRPQINIKMGLCILVCIHS